MKENSPVALFIPVVGTISFFIAAVVILMMILAKDMMAQVVPAVVWSLAAVGMVAFFFMYKSIAMQKKK